jgi:hypothetical protein
MSWHKTPPNGRVWALVLWDHAYHPIPAVAQYEPRSRAWLARDGTSESWPADQCTWHPLPHHERFNEKTHVLLPWSVLGMECPMCTEWVHGAAPNHYAEGTEAECWHCGCKVEVRADGEGAYLEDMTEEGEENTP